MIYNTDFHAIFANWTANKYLTFTTADSAVSRDFLELVHQFGHPKNEPKNSSSTLPKSFHFVRQVNTFLLCDIYRKLDILNSYLWVKYSMIEEKHGDFMIKTSYISLNPNTPSFEQATGNHSKQFRPCLYMVQNYQFQIEIVVGGENGLLSKFYLFNFFVKKK